MPKPFWNGKFRAKMPLYFAYGSNMDKAAMSERCPQARALGTARLARHQFFIMADGFASVRRHPNSDVHGVLYDVGFGDLKRLDRYEDLALGLYVKVSQPVLRQGGGSVRALLYVGGSELAGEPKPHYFAAILRAARAWQMPANYIDFLECLAGPLSLPAQSSSQFRAIKLKTIL
jgi:gamma-glutamylcyclotransferase (GGCT)/AIG2-like uncharacterized protein YtfP